MSKPIYTHCRVSKKRGKVHTAIFLEKGEEDKLVRAVMQHISEGRKGQFCLWYSPTTEDLIVTREQCQDDKK